MQDKEIEIEAATVEKAIQDTLKKFGLKDDDIDVTILDRGSKGILGFNKRPAKILVKKNFDIQSFVEKFFGRIIEIFNLRVDVVTKYENRSFFVELVGEDADWFIGKHGCVLYAYQHMLNLAIKKYGVSKVYLDAGNYRAERNESLKRYAFSCARKVVKTKIKYIFEPMTAYERLVIHEALKDFPGVTTCSIGENENRRVVIELKN